MDQKIVNRRVRKGLVEGDYETAIENFAEKTFSDEYKKPVALCLSLEIFNEKGESLRVYFSFIK